MNCVKEQNSSSLTSLVRHPNVLLKTLKLNAKGPVKCMSVRALIVTGSERSYFLRQTAARLGCVPLGQETMMHSLFGTHAQHKYERKHSCYKVELGNLNGRYAQDFEVLDQPIICGDVSSLKKGSWMEEI